MTAKEYLKQVYRLSREIELKKIELESYRELSENVSSIGFEERNNATRNIEAPYVKFSVKIVDKEKEIEKDSKRLKELKYKLGVEIDRVNEINQRLVLRYRYLMCMSWEDIATKLRYSLRWTYKVHNEAVSNFQKMLKNQK